MTRKQSSLFPDSDTSNALNVRRGLERAEVEPLAFKIVKTIDPYCSRAEVARAPKVDESLLLSLSGQHVYLSVQRRAMSASAL